MDQLKKNVSPELTYASIPGPDLISKAFEAGIGNNVSGFVGAMIDDRYSPPIEINGIVHSLKRGDLNAELEAVIKVNNNYIIFTNKRKPFISYKYSR